MSKEPELGFDTKMIHAGAAPDPSTGARQTPIYQSTSFVFQDAAHAARLFSLQEVGYIYSRLTNPTVAVLQERMAALEGGCGAVAAASGHAAQLLALFPLMNPGCTIVAADKLYGGTVNQFGHAIQRFGAKIAQVANDAQVPLIVDNTMATPALCRPIEHGAHIVVSSTTKFIRGRDRQIPIADNACTGISWAELLRGAWANGLYLPQHRNRPA